MNKYLLSIKKGVIVTHKLQLVILVFIILLSACAKPVEIVRFEGSEMIQKGEAGYLEWEVKNATNIKIETFSQNFEQLDSAGKINIKPTETQSYTLMAQRGKNKQFKTFAVLVYEPKPKERPVVEPEVSHTKSDYLRGLIDYRKTQDLDWKYRIFGFDKTMYPDEIGIYLAVTDNYGNFVANLAPPYGDADIYRNYFKQIIEEISGNKREITNFTVTEHHDIVEQNYNFSLVLDHSGSMVDDIGFLENSVRRFYQFINTNDNVSVVKYDHRIELESPLLPKRESLNKYRFDQLSRFGSMTSLIAAASKGIQTLQNVSDNKIMLLFTDGWENQSLFSTLVYDNSLAFSAKDLIFRARENNVKIYTIGLGQVDEKLLSKIAFLTDAKYYESKGGKELEDIFEELPRLFHNYYRIAYRPSPKSGEHNITIDIVNANGRNLQVSSKTYIGDDFDVSEYDYIEPQAIAFYQLNESEVENSYIPNIVGLASYLKNNPKSRIEIHGHTDSQGNDRINKALSKRRAEMVKQHLVSLGINPNRITTFGFAFERPIHNYDNEEWQRRENRRTEILLIEK